MPLNCPRCPKLCNFPWEMERHLLTHLKQDKKKVTGDSFECSEKECGKQYAQKTDLISHKRIHTDDALVCTVDTMKFITKQALHRHMIIHSGTQPFQCAVCGNKFAQPSNMRTHVKTVHNYRDYMNRADKCEYCGEAQSSVVNMHHHLLEEHTVEVKHKMEKYFKELQSKKKRKDKAPTEHNETVNDAIIEKLNKDEDNMPIKHFEQVPREVEIRKQPDIQQDEPEEEVDKVGRLTTSLSLGEV